MRFTPFHALLPQPDQLASQPEMIANARETYPALRAQGFYQLTSDAGYYLLCFTKAGENPRYALGGLVDVSSYNQADGQGIRPHEATLPARAAVHRQRIADYGAMVKPVLLTTSPDQLLLEKLARLHATTSPYATYPCKEDIISLYLVVDPEQVNEIRTFFNNSSSLFAVADGHHRIRTVQDLSQDTNEKFRKLPVMIMPSECLGIDTFIRSISAPDVTLDTIDRYFERESLPEPLLPTQRGEWLLGCRGDYYRLRGNDKQEKLDAVWFNDTVLPEVFDIHDSRKNPRLTSVEASEGRDTFLQLMQQQPDDFHFFGHPLDMDDFFGCIAAQELLPPKSTYFYPRVPTGLVGYEF